MVIARDHPVGAALKDADLGRRLGHLRHELRRAATVADDRHPPARKVLAVIPFGGMEGDALEAIHAIEIRPGRLVELADRGDQHGGSQHLAVGQFEPPAGFGLLELRARHLDVAAHMGA